MKGRFFLDTNVVVYALDPTFGPKSETALALLRDAVRTKRGVISYQVVQEFFNVALRRFARPLPMSEAENYLQTVFRPLLAVHSSPVLFLEALRIHSVHRISWYDSLIISAAKAADCQIIYTEDLQSGRNLEGLLIENPFAERKP